MILQPRLARSGKISEACNSKILSNHDMTSSQTFSWISYYIYKCTSPPPKRKHIWRSCLIFEGLHCSVSPGDGLSTRCGARRCLSFSPSYKQVGFYRGGCWDESWGFATVFFGRPEMVNVTNALGQITQYPAPLGVIMASRNGLMLGVKMSLEFFFKFDVSEGQHILWCILDLRPFYLSTPFRSIPSHSVLCTPYAIVMSFCCFVAWEECMWHLMKWYFIWHTIMPNI